MGAISGCNYCCFIFLCAKVLALQVVSEKGVVGSIAAEEDEASCGSRRETEGRQYLFTDIAKRFIDVLVSFSLLACLLPGMLLVAFFIKLTSKGPVFYLQKRLTQGGKIFSIYKFRTMRTDAEAESGPRLAAAGDDRITSIGRVLRRTRIDELPQLINVLTGEMSLVGPRPERPEIAEELNRQLPLMKRRLEVKPGITGLAQIKQGYADSYDSYRTKLAWDIYYIERRSLALDFYIAAQTVIVLATGYGAR